MSVTCKVPSVSTVMPVMVSVLRVMGFLLR